MSEHVSPEAAELLVQEVSAWYAEQILEQRRAGDPDPALTERLKADLALCAADQQALEGADQEEIDAIAARYAARAKELNDE